MANVRGVTVKGGLIAQGLTMAKSNVSIVVEVEDVLPAQGKVDIMKYSIGNLYVNMTVFSGVENVEINVDLICLYAED